MHKKVIGVIGGYGMVGREVVKYLLKRTSHDILIGGRVGHKGGAFPEDRVSYQAVDVFKPFSLGSFCRSCMLVINCAGPAAVVREKVALAALRHRTHYVDPGGYNPAHYILNRCRDELQEKGIAMVLATGILPGLSEVFPIHEARRGFDSVHSMELAYIGRDQWSHNSAYDIAWGVGNIGKGEAPIFYEQGEVREAKLLTSGKSLPLPQPIGAYTLFPVFREELRWFVEDECIDNVRVYGNNWGLWVSLATIAVKLFGWHKSPKQLHQAASLISKAAQRDLKDKRPGFMLHLNMEGLRSDQPVSLTSTLYFEETYRATGICVAIAAQMIAEGTIPAGCHWASQIPNVDIFMERFLQQGYSIDRSDTCQHHPRVEEAVA